MAWNWNSAPIGTLRGTSADSTAETKKRLNIQGISANAITSTPEQTVATVNKILAIGGKEMLVDKELTYNMDNEVINNE